MKFETINKEYYQECATVNYPNNYDYLRITEFKHMHPIDSKNTTILKEYPQAHVRGVNTPYYPIFTDECREKYLRYVERSKDVENLLLVGRLAEYKYYDMDDMVGRALEVFLAVTEDDK
jgi:UDP-galactopyranose mutase